MATPSPSFSELLAAFATEDVEVIVVGGVAAVLWGAPVSTFDLDVVYRRNAENVARLCSVLETLEARYRDPAGRDISPDADRFLGGGHHQLLTILGPVDLLAAIGAELAYEDLLPRTELLEVDELEVRVLSLETIIETKEDLARDKDRAMLAVLKETLRLRSE